MMLNNVPGRLIQNEQQSKVMWRSFLDSMLPSMMTMEEDHDIPLHKQRRAEIRKAFMESHPFMMPFFWRVTFFRSVPFLLTFCLK